MDDKEIKAIADIIASLEGLDSQAKTRVFKYVVDRTGVQGILNTTAITMDRPPIVTSGIDRASFSVGPFTNIRSLSEEKRPDTAIQMAVLVGYYLKEVATGEEKKDSMDVSDIEKYFVQANFPLPKNPIDALKNAKAAGYLESADRGRYRLNPVGHNLATHGLPPKGGSSNAKRTKAKKIQKKGSPKK